MTHAKAYRLALQDAQRRFPGVPAADLDDEVNEILRDWAADAARGLPEDSPCLEAGRDNCDDFGTGEGRFHGRF